MTLVEDAAVAGGGGGDATTAAAVSTLLVDETLVVGDDDVVLEKKLPSFICLVVVAIRLPLLLDTNNASVVVEVEADMETVVLSRFDSGPS